MDSEGVRPIVEKIAAVQELPEPTNVGELRALLGIVNYYGKYVHQLATILEPFHHLLQKNARWNWGPDQKKAFRRIKEELQSPNLLVHYDPGKPLVLACDASPYGVGAVLAHRMENGEERPVSYASRTLSKAERNYAQLDKEALGLVYGVKKFHQYLYGRSCEIITDHKPLLGLLGEGKGVPQMASARLQRWALTLSAYDYKLIYKPGCCHGNADAFSRLPLPEEPKETPVPPDITVALDHVSSETLVCAEQIKEWTRRDPLMSQVWRYTMQGWPDTIPSEVLRDYWGRRDEISTEDGCLFWGSRVIIPPQGREAILEELHETHPGIVRMKGLARSYVWWPGLDGDIEAKVQGCQPCQENMKSVPTMPIHPWQFPKKPWRRIHIDYAGPLEGKMYLVIIDAYSKWMDVHVVDHATSAVTIKKLRQTFANQGLPEVLVSDNAACFVSEEFKEFLQENGIRHLTSPVYHPNSNGLAERAVQTFKCVFKKITGTIQCRVSKFLLHYRSTPTTVTGLSPSEMLNKRRLRTRLDLVFPNVEKRVYQGQEKYQRRKPGQDREFQVGEKVHVQTFGSGSKWSTGVVAGNTPSKVIVDTPERGEIYRHKDHVRKRHSETVGSQEPTETPQSVVVPEPPGPVLTPAPSPVPSPQTPIAGGTPRRSERVRKAPIRMDL